MWTVSNGLWMLGGGAIAYVVLEYLPLLAN